MADPARVLGLDPGLATTGWAVIEPDAAASSRVRALGYGVLTTKPVRERGPRLHEIALKVAELIEVYRPTLAAVERLFFSSNARTAMAVSEARGVLLATLASRGIPVVELNPMEVKKNAVGEGRAVKKQMQAMMTRIFNLAAPPTPDDAADALAIALAGLRAGAAAAAEGKR